MKVLITGGGTEEVIDAARCITNFSTGSTACNLATEFSFFHEVTLVINHRTRLESNKINILKFKSFRDLDKILQRELKNDHYDAVIHLAAVSDYSVREIVCDNQSFLPNENLKLSSQKDMILKLSPNYKIVDRLKDYSQNKKLKVIAFKLTKNLSIDEAKNKVAQIFASSPAAFVVHNDLIDINDQQHCTRIFDPELNIVAEGNSKKDLSSNLLKFLEIL